jgi:hypothetical protein
MYSMVKEYLKQNKVIITYVRNDLGFKIGIVVAIGQNKIGWSMVNHRHDYESRDLKLHQVPAIQKMLQRVKDYKPGVMDKNGKEIPAPKVDIFQSKAYRLYLDMAEQGWKGDCEIMVPHFDREEGLRRAIEMAVNGTFKVDKWMNPFQGIDQKDPDFDAKVDGALACRKPHNSYMVDAIDAMIDRSHRIKAFQE